MSCKYLIYFFIMLSSVNVRSQNLDKKDFLDMVHYTMSVIYSLEKQNIEPLVESFNLEGKNNFTVLKKIVSSNALREGRVFTVPAFTKTKSSLIFNLTIISFKFLKKRQNENFERGKYFFIILAKVRFNEKNSTFEYIDPQIVVEEDRIQSWWLSQYMSYVTLTSKIQDQFGYMSPPPAPPPENLK